MQPLEKFLLELIEDNHLSMILIYQQRKLSVFFLNNISCYLYKIVFFESVHRLYKAAILWWTQQ